MKRKHLLMTLLLALCVPMAMNAQLSLPYSENFQFTNLNSLPSGWTIYETVGTGNVVVQKETTTGTNNVLAFVITALNGNSGGVAVRMPLNSSGVSYMKMSFRLKPTSTTAGTFKMGYYSGTNNFTTLATYQASSGVSWRTITDLPITLPDRNRLLLSMITQTANTGWIVDDIEITDGYRPTNIASSNIGDNAATITWDDNDAAKWQIQYKLSSESNWTAVGGTLSSTSYTFSDLLAGTSYDVRVRAKTPSGTFYSGWSETCTFTTTGCAIPTNINVTAEPSVTIVNWEGDAPLYNMEYRSLESIFNYYNGSVVSSNNYYSFDGTEPTPLVDGMRYKLRVQAQCSPESASEWSDWVEFQTACPNYLDLPLHADFDYMPVSPTNTANNLPGCWTYVNTSTDPDYKNYPLVENNQSLCYSNYYPSFQYNYVRFNIPANGEAQYLVFPPIDPVSSNGITVSFYYRSESSETLSNFVVGLMDQSLNTSEFYTKSGCNGGGYSTTYYQVSFTFTSEELTQHGNYFVIKAPSDNAHSVSFCIDDIAIYPADYICYIPSSVHTTEVTATTAQIAWMRGGTETQWGLQYKKSTDNEWNAVYDPGISSMNWTLADLEPNTTYNVRVRSWCNDIDHSDWNEELIFTTLGVMPVPTNLAVDEDNTGSSWVTLTWECTPVTGQSAVSRYELEVSEDGETWHGPDGTIYSMWWTANQSMMINCLDRGQHYFHVRAVDNEDNEGAWSEAVFVTLESCDSPVDIDSEHWVSYNFNATHLPDCWTVTGKYDKIVLGSSLSFWVNEDYETYVELPRFNITDPDYDGIKLSFDWEQMPLAWDNGTQAGVQVQYSANGTQWSNAGDFISMYGDVVDMQTVYCVRNIPASNSTLYVRLKLVVENYHYFSYIPPQCSIDNLYVFGQRICDDAPTNLHVMEGYPANKQVFLSWMAGNNEQSQWQLCISKNSDSNWQLTSPFMSEDCTMGFNVDHNSTYHVKVRAYCDNNHYSGWSDEIIFTTPYFGKIFTGAEDDLWSNANNWIGGIPSEEDDVLLQADVTITGEAEAYIIDIDSYSITVEDGGLLNANSFIGGNAGNPLKTVIKDGGQVKSDTPFLATIEKNITGYGAENVGGHSGYYLITSPTYLTISEGNVIPREDDTPLYDQIDFYWFNGYNPGEEWCNPKEASGFIDGRTMLIRTKGYLYARQNNGTLSFMAAPSYSGSYDMRFQATNEDISVDLTSYSNSTAPFNGWNLIGNPFTCDAYLLDENGDIMPFYRMNDAGDAIVGGQPGTAIKPCEGVFVFCPNDSQSHRAVFTTTALATVGEAQNDLVVVLPIHNLLDNQNASIGTVTQTIELSTGWNWFSPYVEAEDPIALLQMLEAALGANAEQIQSSETYTEYYDGGWWGELDEEGITSDQTYWIYATTDCTVELEGTPVNTEGVEITINPGWNWIGFPSAVELDVNDALGGFEAEDGDQLQGEDIYTEYYGGWWGELETLIPGEGYWYYSSSNVTKTLVFQIGAKAKLVFRLRQ